MRWNDYLVAGLVGGVFGAVVYVIILVGQLVLSLLHWAAAPRFVGVPMWSGLGVAVATMALLLFLDSQLVGVD